MDETISISEEGLSLAKTETDQITFNLYLGKAYYEKVYSIIIIYLGRL